MVEDLIEFLIVQVIFETDFVVMSVFMKTTIFGPAKINDFTIADSYKEHDIPWKVRYVKIIYVKYILYKTHSSNGMH